jgi:5-methylcytosine-specific restriction endonuclease McrA
MSRKRRIYKTKIKRYKTYEEQQYDLMFKEWRSAVFRRDKYKCQMPGCGDSRGIQAHHIRMRSVYPTMSFLVSNGITLCRKCHQSIRQTEENYVALFLSIVYSKGNK